MAGVPPSAVPQDLDYPVSDRRPIGETEVHRDNLFQVIDTLKLRFEADPLFYVTGDLLLYYVRGAPQRRVSPDVFVVRGVVKQPRRRYYLLWEECKAPELVVEFTSPLTREEDLQHKFQLCQDTLKVQEYFLFDPYEDYLEPSLQGYRLRRGNYAPIQKVKKRLPSTILGLHLERDGWDLRFFDPAAGQRVPTCAEAHVQAMEKLEEIRQAQAAWQQQNTETARLRRQRRGQS